jgi:lipoate-protein ligase A
MLEENEIEIPSVQPSKTMWTQRPIKILLTPKKECCGFAYLERKGGIYLFIYLFLDDDFALHIKIFAQIYWF